MRDDPRYAPTDLAEVRALIRAHPWAMMASSTPDGVVVSLPAPLRMCAELAWRRLAGDPD